MNPREEAATTVDELLVLSKDKSVNQIVVRGELAGVPSIRVSPGQSLRGEDESSGLTFAEGTDGLQLGDERGRRGGVVDFLRWALPTEGRRWDAT